MKVPLIVTAVVIAVVITMIVLNKQLGKTDVKNAERQCPLSARSFLNEKATLLCVLPGNGSVTGIAVLGSELFVVRGSASVDVYNTNNLSLSRTIIMPTDSRAYSIDASPLNNCLYISDYLRQTINRYNLSDNVMTDWSVDGWCLGLSLTSTHNVLVTLEDTKQIKEYTPDGRLIREISLDYRFIVRAWHSAQVSSTEFVVTHSGIGNRRLFSIVDASGRIKRSYQGAHVESPHWNPGPGGWMAFDRYNNVIVVDLGSYRVEVFSLIDSAIIYMGYIGITGNVQADGTLLNKPQAVRLDQLNRRLYIGTDTGHVLVLTV